MFFTLLKDEGYLDCVMWFTYRVMNITCPSALLSVQLWLKLGQLFYKVHASNLLTLYNRI